MAFFFNIRHRLRFFPLLPKPPLTIPASLCSLSATASPSLSTPRDPKLSLSAHLSFVFEQIDALERQRDISGKDEALQRIRYWRQSKHTPPPPPLMATADGGGSGIDTQMTENAVRENTGMADIFRREVEVVHPWPEWIELMERLAIQNYFDYRRVEEDRVAANAGIDLSGVKEDVGLDLTRDWAAVRTACMNFGRDRFDILKSLSMKDIQTMVGHGCPSMDPKVVFSAKLLRKYAHVDEGDVCSSCSLRNTCSRGYILVPKEDEARTLDVMRILLTYGFDHVKESVENDILRKMKSVKSVVRGLLHEVVKLSAVPRDPNLLPPVISKPPKVKQPPPQPKRRVGRDDVEMKKGDWLCSKCDFMNFAKNVVCLQCDAKRPKRQLLPGEWECPKCNFLNYRRNMSCFQCEHNRPPGEFTENLMQGKQMGPTTRLQRAARTSGVSNAWNFDFDDDESDGADVAAFEFADSSKACGGSSLDELPHGGWTREFEDDNTLWNQDKGQYVCNRDKQSSLSHSQATGFDDFDDEEDDNVDNYELDEANCKETHAISRKSLSEFENDSGSENSDDLDQCDNTNKYGKDHLSDFDDDDDIVVEHGRKSFDSGNVKEPIYYSAPDMHDNYDLKHTKRGKQNAGKKCSPRTDSDFDDELFSDFDDEDEDLFSSSSKKNGITGASDRIGCSFKDSNNFGLKSNGRNSFVHDENENDLFFRSNKKKGISGASERRGHSYKDSNHFRSKNNGRNSFVHDEDGEDDQCFSRNRKKGHNGALERTERRFQVSNHFGSKNNGRDFFVHRNDEKFNDWGGTNLRNRGRVNQFSYGARGFPRSRVGSKGNGYGKWNHDNEYKRSAHMVDHRKIDYSHY